MSEYHRKSSYRDRDRDDYRHYEKHRSMSDRRSPRHDRDKLRSRSPTKIEKDHVDDIMRDVAKLPAPNEMWDAQFQDISFAPPPPTFNQETTSYTTPSYYTGIYDEFPSMPPAPQPPEIAWNQLSLPPALPAAAPPPAPPPETSFQLNAEDKIKKDAAIESEVRHQKAALSKQREDYIKKAAVLKKELETLKDQRSELRGDSKRSPSPDTKRFLKENTKLQLEIQNRLKTIDNVVDMLNGIIGEGVQKPREPETAERTTKRQSRSPTKFNYVYYDPEMHWCRICNEFPPTAKDYLNHLHTPAHHKMAVAHMEAPWHSMTGVNEGFPSYPDATNKRTPIRGLQFFVPSTAWYCKLCDQFIGDLHCASAHLKSLAHSKNYSNFVEQNPHWETDWMSDRQKAFEKSRTTKVRVEEKPQYTAHTITFNKDGFHTKTKSPSPSGGEDSKKEKKKKEKRKIRKRKKSESSSSCSDSSADSEPVKKKKSKSKKVKSRSPDVEDKSLNEWMSSIAVDKLSVKDRKLLDSLKSKIKSSRESEKREQEKKVISTQERERPVIEVHRKIRESDRHESKSKEPRRREPQTRTLTPPQKEKVGNKKPELKKMPFIGKMPVFKTLGKTAKTEEPKKDDIKKTEDIVKKRREEMDAEIQKKVAEFREKITKTQLEREQQARVEMTLPPPGLALPTELGGPPQMMPLSRMHTQPPPPTVPPNPNQPNLSRDFQEALDIIFPSADAKKEMNTGNDPSVFVQMPPGFTVNALTMPPPPYNTHGMPPQMLPNMNQQMMMGFDLNAPMFPRPQLYDNHVPIVPNQKGRLQSVRHQNQHLHAHSNEQNGESGKNKEMLDDLAMLGIDASDVGAM